MPQTITGIILESTTTFAGKFPDIPVSETILRELGDNPMFVTLPIGRVNSLSRNGRKYDREAVQAIVEAINNEKSIGQKGHLRDDERAYRFDIPPLMWVAATLEANGIAWAKAFVMEHAEDVREYIRVAKASNARIGTSIYGTATIEDDGTVRDLQIESIDLAHPGRLGVEMAGAVPVVTQETVVSSEPSVADAISELRRQQDAELLDLAQRRADLERQARQVNTIRELLGISDDESIALHTRLLIQRNRQLRDERTALLDSAIDVEVAQHVAVKPLRPIVAQMVREQSPRSAHAIQTAVQNVIQRPDVRAMLTVSEAQDAQASDDDTAYFFIPQ